MKKYSKYLSVATVSAFVGFGVSAFLEDAFLSKAEASQMAILKQRQEAAKKAPATAVPAAGAVMTDKEGEFAKTALRAILGHLGIGGAVLTSVDKIDTDAKRDAIVAAVHGTQRAKDAAKSYEGDELVKALLKEAGLAENATALNATGANHPAVTRDILKGFLPVNNNAGGAPWQLAQLKNLFNGVPANATAAQFKNQVIYALRHIRKDAEAGKAIANAAGVLAGAVQNQIHASARVGARHPIL